MKDTSWRSESCALSEPRCCVLFLNPADGEEMFELETGDVLLELLGETSGFEFYVTDHEASFLFCFTHHDVLVAAGNAAPWLAALDTTVAD